VLDASGLLAVTGSRFVLAEIPGLPHPGCPDGAIQTTGTRWSSQMRFGADDWRSVETAPIGTGLTEQARVSGKRRHVRQFDNAWSR
jgi:hypothetical protein